MSRLSVGSPQGSAIWGVEEKGKCKSTAKARGFLSCLTMVIQGKIWRLQCIFFVVLVSVSDCGGKKMGS